MTELVPAVILFGAYAVLAVGQPPLLRMDRTGAAVIGAILMVSIGGLPLDDAFRAVVSSILHPAAQVVAVVVASGTLSALSNLTSEVPAVVLFTRSVPHLPDPQTSWLALACRARWPAT
jgi:hypothetical protein